jgi:hypothetical protein
LIQINLTVDSTVFAVNQTNSQSIPSALSQFSGAAGGILGVMALALAFIESNFIASKNKQPLWHTDDGTPVVDVTKDLKSILQPTPQEKEDALVQQSIKRLSSSTVPQPKFAVKMSIPRGQSFASSSDIPRIPSSFEPSRPVERILPDATTRSQL